MDGRQVDTESKIAELESVLAHGDAQALYDASCRAALALEFRGVDEMIGLAPVALEQVERMRNLIVAALERAAQLGHLQAGVDLANRLYFSRQSERATEAFAFALRASSIPRALYLLGLFCYAGFGCEKDVTESLRYHHLAAQAGEPDAMFELYVFYIKGVGVAVDKAAAVSWCQRAAEAGSSRAMANLGGFYATGDGVEQDSALAVSWYDRAASAGSGRAAATLGVMYALGDGVTQSDDAARKYFRIAQGLRFDWRTLAEQCGLDCEAYEGAP